MSTTKNRHIALFPGAFRPPHQAHYAAIQELVSQPEIDEVVVIIANRCRYIPGTSKALGAEVACQVLEIYLQNIPKVRLEIAQHDAISHALSYLDRADPGDALLFCIGEADFERGDDRFEELVAQRKHDGISVTVVPAATGSMPIRATTLREALAVGESKRTEFIAGLPPHLSREQCENVWSICHNGLRPVSDITGEKLRTILVTKLHSNINELTVVVPDKLDPVFRVQLGDKTVFIKYAGDTTEAGSLGQHLKPKPRRRLGAERRALKYLHALELDVELADVILFDKETLTLVLSEVCPDGTSLQEQLQAAVFDPQVAAAASHFIATCHSVTGPIPALWGEPETDLQHWQAMLALRTTDLQSPLLSPSMRHDLQQLKRSSEHEREKHFFHLDYVPKNIRISQEKIGVIDFELCSSIGDPAYDLGNFLGHYLWWGICSSSEQDCLVALHAALNAYQQKVGAAWRKMSSRVVAFAGAGILFNLEQRHHGNMSELEQHLLETAASLLSRGVNSCDDAELALSSALTKG